MRPPTTATPLSRYPFLSTCRYDAVTLLVPSLGPRCLSFPSSPQTCVQHSLPSPFSILTGIIQLHKASNCWSLLDGLPQLAHRLTDGLNTRTRIYNLNAKFRGR